jgi:periplasmic divalent cation tolerance protein
MAGQCFLCLVTCKNSFEAKKIALALVKGKLARCTNIIDKISSVYEWEGKIYDEDESLLLIKGAMANKAKLVKKIRNLHSYKVPEIIFFKIDSGFDKYLSWLMKK